MANESAVLVVTGSLTDKKATGAVALKVDQLPGYDAEETQTLKHVNGALTWVTDAA